MPRGRAPRAIAASGPRGEPSQPTSRRARADAPDRLGGEHVEGRQAVRELLVANRRAIRQILIDRGAADALVELTELGRARGAAVRLVERAEFEANSRTEAPQGVIAFAEPVHTYRVRELVTVPILSPGESAFLVALDGVTDPGNLGAILRTAYGAGATGAIIARHNAARLSPTAMKAAAGAVEYLPIAMAPAIASAVQELARLKIWSVGLDMHGDRGIDEVEVLSEPVVLVLGDEHGGLSELVRARCDVLARIELHGQLDSLNVSAAAAVACFTVSRHRGLLPTTPD